VRAAAAVALGMLAGLLALAPSAAQAASTVTQPTPPVSASSFPQEPTGAAPVDGDGLIPNPETPTGSAIAAPDSCTVTFTSASGATSATVNTWISQHENGLTSTAVVCLSGTFTSPLHVWAKSSTALLELAPAPGSTATLDLGSVKAADIDPNQFWSDAGGMSIVDSRSVEVYGLTIENYTTDGTTFSPAGIYVTVRSDDTEHLSACFAGGGSCSDIYILDDTVRHITNTADETFRTAKPCATPDVAAYGIAVIAAGSSTSPALQHVVVEGDTVSGTRTGESETTTFNGDLEDFLVADNTIDNVDNIGIDTIGWEVGSSQANHAHIYDNVVYNVDTLSNGAYGTWNGSTCVSQPENAAGIYDDGGSYIWIDGNTVWNTDQGINLDVETKGKSTGHLLVSGNTVHDDPGTSSADPSDGPNPPGTSGSSTVAGHDLVAFYVDAFGSGARISDVYAHDNVFQNESQYFLDPSDGMPTVDVGGIWSDVELWHNTVEGEGATDLYNPLMEVDELPAAGTSVINCNDYGDLSTSASTVNGNFALPSTSWLKLSGWQSGNGHGWDTDSAVGAFSTACPTTSAP